MEKRKPSFGAAMQVLTMAAALGAMPSFTPREQKRDKNPKFSDADLEYIRSLSGKEKKQAVERLRRKYAGSK